MGKTVIVAKRPKCDLSDCTNEAYGDFATSVGWANLCKPHSIAMDCKVGTGCGQVFIVEGEKHPEFCDCKECKKNKSPGK